MTTHATNHHDDEPTGQPYRPASDETDSADESDGVRAGPVIDATEVTKRYGDVTALDGVSLAVERGETVGLLGTNGAGKTTLFKLLVGHLRPDGGTLAVAGLDVRKAGVALRHAVGYLPEHSGFPGALTGREVLAYHATMRAIPTSERSTRVESTLATVGLSDAADRAVAGYSNGMGRRLGLAAAVLAAPRILLLDEPTAGLDPLGVATFHRVLDRLRDGRDLTVLVSSHALGEVDALCDRVVVMHEGSVHAAGTIPALTGGATDAEDGLGPTDGATNSRGLARLFEALDSRDDGAVSP